MSDSKKARIHVELQCPICHAPIDVWGDKYTDFTFVLSDWVKTCPYCEHRETPILSIRLLQADQEENKEEHAN